MPLPDVQWDELDVEHLLRLVHKRTLLWHHVVRALYWCVQCGSELRALNCRAFWLCFSRYYCVAGDFEPRRVRRRLESSAPRLVCVAGLGELFHYRWPHDDAVGIALRLGDAGLRLAPHDLGCSLVKQLADALVPPNRRPPGGCAGSLFYSQGPAGRQRLFNLQQRPQRKLACPWDVWRHDAPDSGSIFCDGHILQLARVCAGWLHDFDFVHPDGIRARPLCDAFCVRRHVSRCLRDAPRILFISSELLVLGVDDGKVAVFIVEFFERRYSFGHSNLILRHGYRDVVHGLHFQQPCRSPHRRRHGSAQRDCAFSRLPRRVQHRWRELYDGRSHRGGGRTLYLAPIFGRRAAAFVHRCRRHGHGAGRKLVPLAFRRLLAPHVSLLRRARGDGRGHGRLRGHRVDGRVCREPCGRHRERAGHF